MERRIRIHPTAIVESHVEIGRGTSVWDSVHIRSGARIGEDCIIGEKTYVAGGASIGNLVKINAMVYIPPGVTIEDGVMIAAHTVFTNDQFPRACTPDLSRLRSSAVDEHTRWTRVCAGATIGANATIGSDLTIGRFAMVGMGAVVTRSVKDFQLVVGVPAKPVACVCRCGQPVFRLGDPTVHVGEKIACSSCGWLFRAEGDSMRDLGPSANAEDLAAA